MACSTAQIVKYYFMKEYRTIKTLSLIPVVNYFWELHFCWNDREKTLLDNSLSYATKQLQKKFFQIMIKENIRSLQFQSNSLENKSQMQYNFYLIERNPWKAKQSFSNLSEDTN